MKKLVTMLTIVCLSVWVAGCKKEEVKTTTPPAGAGTPAGDGTMPKEDKAADPGTDDPAADPEAPADPAAPAEPEGASVPE